MKLMGILAAGVSAALLTAGAASAATVIAIPNASAIDAAAVAANDVFNFATPTTVVASGTYDFTFGVATTADINIDSQAQASHKGTSYVVTLDLYSGAPGAGTLLDSNSATAASFSDILSPGNYYLEVSQIKAPTGNTKVSVSGSISPSAVPEPAAWSLMLMGVGGLGAALRRRRQMVAA